MLLMTSHNGKYEYRGKLLKYHLSVLKEKALVRYNIVADCLLSCVYYCCGVNIKSLFLFYCSH